MEPTIIVDLTLHEVFMAAMHGVSRQVKNIGNGAQARWGQNANETGWQNACDGCCAEMAVAKWLGVYYNGNLGNYDATDAGPYQVRTTCREFGSLILHEDDPDDDKFVLVLSHACPKFVLRGWCYAHEGKKEKYWKELVKGRPAFFVPQTILRNMQTLETGES